MSHIHCPMCAKHAPGETFDPNSLDLDLVVTTHRGLGRGKGFEVASRESVLGDEHFSPMVANRSVNLVKMFLDKGVLKKPDVYQRLEIEDTGNGARGF